MRHAEPTDEVRELAALYALGALSAEESAGFEAHLAEGCRTCAEEVRELSTVAGLVGVGVPAVAPRPGLRDALLARLAGEDSAWIVVRRDDGEWQAGGAGLELKYLYRDTIERRYNAIGRLEPGARRASHRHSGVEELYVLAGDIRLHGRVLRVGDYCVAAAGTVHGDMITETGCTFLLVASERDEPVDSAATDDRGLTFVAARDRAWREGPAAGVTTRQLFANRPAGTLTAEVRMQPGARLPGHRHMTPEQLYMLEGDAHVGGHVLRAGDYYRAPRAAPTR